MSQLHDDPRRAYIINSIAEAFAPSHQKDSVISILQSDNGGAISAFLDGASTSLLKAKASGLGDRVSVQLSNDPASDDMDDYQVLMAKLQSGPLRLQDIPKKVIITSMSDSPAASLYHAIHSIYRPALESEAGGAKASVDPRLQELMMQLEAALGSNLRNNALMGNSEPSKGHSVRLNDDDTLRQILKPLDEVNFWAELSGSSGPSTPFAQQIHNVLEPLHQPFSSLAQNEPGNWEDVKELIDIVIQCLRDAWAIGSQGRGWPYSRKRATHFLSIIGAEFVGYIQESFKLLDIWGMDFWDLKPHLVSGANVLSTWESEAMYLTRDWAMGVDNNGHSWEGDPFMDSYVASVQERIDEIFRIRESHNELVQLLSDREASTMAVQNVFSVFRSVNALQVSEYTQPLWRAAIGQYEENVAPMENRIAQKLKEILNTKFIPALTYAITQRGEGAANAGAQPHQVFSEILKFSGLLSRPRISASIQPERDAIATQIDRHLDNLQQDLDDRRNASLSRIESANSASMSGRNLPEVVDALCWTVSAKHKLDRTIEVVMAMGGINTPRIGEGEKADDAGLGTLKSCRAVAEDLIAELNELRTELFESWQESIDARLHELHSWKSGKLMTFDKATGKLETHFGDELVSLMKEVRHLQCLGFRIKKDILAEVDTARKLFRYGLVLKQVANFYNDIGTQMIPCQKPMMLKDAEDFEKVLMNPKDGMGRDITWKNVLALGGYSKRLEDVTHRLTEKNRTLRKWHNAVGEKVSELMNTDIIRHKGRWMSSIKEIKGIFARLESEGFIATSQRVWRQHWDFQIHKALEAQYARGLEYVNEALPDVEIKMVFKQRRLQYEPPLEELRTKHYKEYLNAFLKLPLTLTGVSDLSEHPGFFRHIIESSSGGIAKVYGDVEGLFSRLSEELKKYQDWVALGTVDLSEFAEDNLEEVADWVLNFKVLKSAAKDVERVPNEIMVDCYKISLMGVKASIEEHMKNLQDSLVKSLRKKAVQEAEEILEFMRSGRAVLETQANNIEEIGNARKKAKCLVDDLSRVVDLRRRVEEKNKLLRQMAGGGNAAQFAVVDMKDVVNEWDSFTNQLEQHGSVLEERKNQLQGHIVKQIDDINSRIVGFSSRWQELKPKGGPQGEPALILAKIEDFAQTLDQFREEASQIERDCEHFCMDPPDFSVLEEVSSDIDKTKEGWSRYREFQKEKDEIADQDWLSMRDRLWKVEDFLTKWTKLMEGSGTDTVGLIVRREIDSYHRSLPYLKFVKGNGWDRKHWAQLFSMLNFQTKGPGALTVDSLTLAHFLQKADVLVALAANIKDLDAQAQGEAVLRKALDELNGWGYDRKFVLAEYNMEASGRSVSLIKEWGDLMTEVGDNQSLVSSLRQSPYFNLMKDEIQVWEGRLSTLSECLSHLNNTQRKWVYLEPIFAKGALPHHQARFSAVDDRFRQLMGQMKGDPNVVRFAEIPRVAENLPQLSSQLDVCQKALSDFLEEKRSAFPRFYFIGDDDLLEILGQSKNPTVIQAHLRKIFAGIHKVRFSDDQRTITCMLSVEGEQVELADAVHVSENVENWLAQLCDSMQNTLSQQLPRALGQQDFKNHSSQILGLSEAVRFTELAETAIRNGTLKEFRSRLQAQLLEYTASDWTGFRVMQLKIKALVLDVIHYLDVVDQLIEEDVSSQQDWSWKKQLRYAHQGGSVSVCMAEGDFSYSWEYQGNAPKLVYTPLTDKCYLTLTQGMALGYGGNPYGPAGTGKTESVKALGQAFGRQVLVFNCDEEFDFKSMGRIFVGLVRCGAWGCFDEFNRLEEEVLSAVSQQIQTIQGALKEGLREIDFMGKMIDVNKNAGIFVTLNPAGKGYGGRSKLPDNLKQLFRSVAMTVPDNELIAEVLLLAEGFKNAKLLGAKIVSLFDLSKQLLSPQQHYDWGLRALKTSLTTAGKMLREEREKGGGAPMDEQNEVKFILRSVRATKLPTLTFEDNKRFLELVCDVFPNQQISDVADDELQRAIESVMVEWKLEVMPGQVEKILQFHLACEQRIGVIIVGPSGSGKSTLWLVLEAAYKKLKKPMARYVMNPKAINRQLLLGKMDLDTREWADGVLTAAARQVVKEPLDKRSWIICDGDVDPEWIESLNSVLDDNRLMTLPSGERIQFANNVNFIFECHSLEFASPATVSRCGMIFVSDDHLGVEHLVDNWLKKETSEGGNGRLESWVKEFFYKSLNWALSHPSAVSTTRVGVINNALSHVQSATTKEEFIVRLTRGLAANMESDVRKNFINTMAKWSNIGNLWEALAGDASACASMGKSLVETKRPGREIVVTDEVQRNLAMIRPWLQSGIPLLLVGPEGCGKAKLLEFAFGELESVSIAVVHCSAQTTATNVLQKLAQTCGKPVTTNQGKVIKPRESERLILYLKDVNLPRADKYGSIQLIAFLQQLITYNGFYDNSLEFVRLQNVQVVATMTPSSNLGKRPLTTRLTSIMRIGCITSPSRDDLQLIYRTMIEETLKDLSGEDGAWSQGQRAATDLANAMIEVFEGIRERFTPAECRHYIFTPRMITHWVDGLYRYGLHGSAGMLDAVYHEGCRIFCDRLTNVESHNEVEQLLRSSLRSLGYRGDSGEGYWTTLGATAEERLSGGDGTVQLTRWDAGDFNELFSEKLKSYEREQKTLNLVLIPEVLERIARFDYVLSRPGGSMLLTGSSGIGRRVCVTLVAFMHHMPLVSPKMSRGYSLKNFKEDLKNVLLATGVDGQPTCLLLEDHQIVDDAFLEYINSLLSGGEVPGLFTNKELEKHLAPLRSTMADEGFGYSNVFAYFSSRVRKNLHVVLSMDPQNDNYWKRCESNPALLTKCFVQWLDVWSHEGMIQLPLALINDVDGMPDPKAVVHCMMRMHELMMEKGAPPRKYTTFAEHYIDIFKKKQQNLEEQQKFLKSGLEKLAEAADTVDALSQSAVKKRKLLTVKQAEAEEALQRISASMARAADRRREVEDLQNKLSVEEVELNERRGGVEEELRSVQPLIDQARKAVGQIKSDNLNEIRSLKMPPEAIRDVLEGVLLLMGQKDTSWNNMRKFLSSKSVKDQIINYDARRVTPEMYVKVEKLLGSKAASFEHANIFRVSVAAAPLASWVKANLAYSKVLRKVKPLEDELHVLMESLDASQRRLAQCKEDLIELDDEVSQLKIDFQKKTSEAESLRVGLEKAEATLQKAEMLLGKLSGEKERWEMQLETLSKDLDILPLNALMSAGFITYLPEEPEDVRHLIQQEWMIQIRLDEYDFRRFMSSESEMLTWKAEGLPGDDLSTENAISILNNSISPLVIDPSTQAIRWLESHLKGTSKTVEIASLQDTRFATALELAVRFGKTLLVHDVDRIEPMLYPLLRKDLEKQGPRLVVRIGDKHIDYNESFCLFLVTRNPHPCIPPDARSLVSITNFTVTRNGLEGQLLSLTLQNEQPELEQQRSSLLGQEEELKVQLAGVEKQLLQTLATSTGNILENEELLQSLNETKAKSATIAAGLEQSEALHHDLDRKREVYRSIAERASLMFFSLKELHTINHMYRFSLPIFLGIFKTSLKTSDTCSDVASRIAVLNQRMVELLFAYISRSLFNVDRLAFGIHLVHMIRSDLFSQEEWNFFLGNTGITETRGGGSNDQKPSWVREELGGAYHSLVTSFPNISSACDFQDVGLWAPWVNSNTATCQLPGRAATALNPFQQLLVVKAFRSDRLIASMASCVCSVLNIKSISPPPFSLASMQHELTANEPVLFLTSPGADPSEELSEFAKQTIGHDRYHEVAMGQGQAEMALDLLHKCAENGDWLCLKNLHLVVSWLPILEKEVHAVRKHKDFRLFFTSEPHTRFPSSLCEGCLKVTFEAPPGVKRNLLRTYEAWSEDFIASGPPIRAQLLFLLAWFHAVIQERRNYIPQGWRKFYEFSFADLRSGADIIVLGTKEGRAPQWSFLHGLLENAIYGGRVDNAFDVKVLRTYLAEYFSPDVVGMAGKTKPLLGSRVLIPTNTNRPTYLRLVESLPDVDSPALFGLPANIDRSSQEIQGNMVLSQLKLMTVAKASAGTFNRAEWSKQLSPFLRLWESLLSSNPHLKPSRHPAAQDTTQESSTNNPLDLFLVLEHECGCRAISTVDSAFSCISRVLKGSSPLSQGVQEDGLSLIKHEVPASWEKIWEGPEDPMMYCQAVISRLDTIDKWVGRLKAASGELEWLDAGSGRAWTVNLAKWFHPETFLNALRQFTARRVGTSIDSLKLVTCWGDGARRLEAMSPVRVTVEGLKIQGGVFDGTKLSPVSQELPSTADVPPGVFAWVPESEPHPCNTTACVPVYADVARCKVLCEVQMPVRDEVERNQWLLAGLALFLQS